MLNKHSYFEPATNPAIQEGVRLLKNLQFDEESGDYQGSEHVDISVHVTHQQDLTIDVMIVSDTWMMINPDNWLGLPVLLQRKDTNEVVCGGVLKPRGFLKFKALVDTDYRVITSSYWGKSDDLDWQSSTVLVEASVPLAAADEIISVLPNVGIKPDIATDGLNNFKAKMFYKQEEGTLRIIFSGRAIDISTAFSRFWLIDTVSSKVVSQGETQLQSPEDDPGFHYGAWEGKVSFSDGDSLQLMFITQSIDEKNGRD